MGVTPDPVQRLEHDHVHLLKMVDDLRETIKVCRSGEEPPAQLHEDFVEFLQLLNEEIYEHFDKEEQGLFPYIAQEFPELADDVAALAVAHDRICGLASRMGWIVSQGPEAFADQTEQVYHLYDRFDAEFAEHSRDEAAVLKSLHGRLTADQRRTIAKMLRDL